MKKIDGSMDKDMGNLEYMKSIIAPHILDVGYVSLIKESLIYQLFSDKMHVLTIGAAGSCAKSSFRYSLSELIPNNFNYVTVSGLTKVGLNEVARKFLMWGLISLDEADKIQKDMPDAMNTLLEMMQTQTVKITKHKTDKPYSTPVNIFATANPNLNRNEWMNYGDVNSMRKQLPFSVPLLRRFHFVIFTDKYTTEEFYKINMFICKNIENKNMYDEEFVDGFNNYIERARAIPIRGMKDPEKEVPESVSRFINNIKDNEDRIIYPVTNEIWRGILAVAWANARIRLSKKLEQCDWDNTIRFLTETMKTVGVNEYFVRSLKK